MSENVKKILKSYWFDGLLLVFIGIWILVWPNAAPKIICVVSGIVLAVLGLLKTIGFFKNKNNERKNQNLLIGLIQLALGVAFLAKTDFFIDFFKVVIAVLMLYACILMLVQAYDQRKEKNAKFKAAVIFAIVTLALAVIILINPIFLIHVISRLTGIALIVVGLAIIFVLRKPADKEDKKEIEDKNNK